MRSRSLLIAALIAGAAPAAARADEGMWTFDNFPAAAVKSKYGVDIDRAWLDRVQAGAVRLSSGCSSSLVSGKGLVFTNHHCVVDCVQSLSTPKADFVQGGYGVGAAQPERRCPGMQAEILLSISDVTDRIGRSAAGKGGADFLRARDTEAGAIEKEACAGKEQVQRCQVIAFYQGGQFKLYTYRKYADVRLVFAPEIATAFFGGDPDNFNFPRYAADFSFVRLYEDGKPAATPAHLKWNPTPPKPGEPVFVAGNPGSTQRLQTVSQLEALRDVALPTSLLQYSELRGRYIRFGQEGTEKARIVTDPLFGVENAFKNWRGQLKALTDPRVMGAKTTAEAELRARVAADPKLAAEIGDPWGEVAKAQAERAALYDRYALLESRGGYGSELFGYARTLVRAAAERPKPPAERLPEYADSRLPLVEKTLLDVRPVEASLEAVQLEFWLSKLREYLTADAPEVKAILGKDSPETLAARLAASKLGDPALRKRLWEGGAAAIRASTDPMIQFFLRVDAPAREVRRAYEQRVSGPTDRAAERIARARFAVYGTSVYPDATFSLRLSYGAVAGWTEPGGAVVPPYTHVRGLYERATGQEPFKLAPAWAAAQGKLNPDTVFDIATTNDVVGGNSGSPTLNAKGEVVGAVFDGNIHSLGGAFAYDPALNRTVIVSAAIVTEALTKVYAKPELVKELTGG
jgi:hypothetical protein